MDLEIMQRTLRDQISETERVSYHCKVFQKKEYPYNTILNIELKFQFTKNLTM